MLEMKKNHVMSILIIVLAFLSFAGGHTAYAYDPSAVDLLEDAILNTRTEVNDLKGYGILVSDIQDKSLINEVIEKNPIAAASYDNIYISSYNYDYNMKITSVVISYGKSDMTNMEFKERYDKMKKRVAEISAYVNPAWSEYRKVLFVHDYIIDNVSYDVDLNRDYELARLSNASHSAYGALVNGRAVCDGYAKAFQLIMGQVGIDSIVVSSDAMVHAWNLVKVDGKWYHIDLTHDDPLIGGYGYDYPGTVWHTNFLMSDSYIKDPTKSAYHSSWETETPKTATDYDKWPYRECKTFFTEIDGNLYYSDTSSEGYLVKEDAAGKKTTINDTKIICLDNVGPYILYNDVYQKTIYCYNGLEIKEYYKSDDGYYVSAFDVKDNTITILLRKAVGTGYTYESITKSITEKELAPEQYIFSGTCSEKVTDSVRWKLDTKTGIMSITGSGAMADYQYSTRTPWFKYRDKIKKVSIASGVTRIGTNAFYGYSNLNEVTGCANVDSIGINTFRNCPLLTKVAGCTKTTLIEQYAFCGSNKLTTIGSTAGTVNVPKCTKIGGYTFYECKGIKKLVTSNVITYIGTRAFSNCTGLTTATIGSSCRTIASYAFCGDTALAAVSGCAGLTGIGDFAFYGNTKLVSVEGCSKAANVGKSVFRNCSALVRVGATADRISLAAAKAVGEYAFSGCKAAKYISLGSNLATIGQYAFQNTSSLQKLYLNTTKLTTVGTNAFKGFKWNGSIYVPKAKLTAYKNGVIKGKGQGTNVNVVAI